jgi:hypothetical protein
VLGLSALGGGALVSWQQLGEARLRRWQHGLVQARREREQRQQRAA